MNADRLCELMLEAQKTAYGDGLDPVTLHPYMWLCKSHYYGMSYYNFPYAFGGLFARGLYAEYRRRGAEFVPVYKQMLAATTHTDVEECARMGFTSPFSRWLVRSVLPGMQPCRPRLTGSRWGTALPLPLPEEPAGRTVCLLWFS